MNDKSELPPLRLMALTQRPRLAHSVSSAALVRTPALGRWDQVLGPSPAAIPKSNLNCLSGRSRILDMSIDLVEPAAAPDHITLGGRFGGR